MFFSDGINAASLVSLRVLVSPKLLTQQPHSPRRSFPALLSLLQTVNINICGGRLTVSENMFHGLISPH